MKPKKRYERKIRKEAVEAWSERNDSRQPESDRLGLSACIIEYQMKYAQKLQEMRLEYIEQFHKEPELTDFEKILIAKYC